MAVIFHLLVEQKVPFPHSSTDWGYETSVPMHLLHPSSCCSVAALGVGVESLKTTQILTHLEPQHLFKGDFSKRQDNRPGLGLTSMAPAPCSSAARTVWLLPCLREMNRKFTGTHWLLGAECFACALWHLAVFCFICCFAGCFFSSSSFLFFLFFFSHFILFPNIISVARLRTRQHCT